MRAILYDRYGPPEVLELREVASPVPAVNEVLVQMRAAALNPKDSLIRKGKFRRVTLARFPRGLGYDVSGVVKAIGKAVTRFAVGDEVFGMKQAWAGGTIAEEVCLLEDELAKKPVGMSFEEAAATPLAALTALQALRDEARLQPGQRVLINGASGGVGVFAIQVARALGAKVTTLSSARNFELCRSLGADETWDYATRKDLGSGWDVFFDVFGNRSFGAVRSALATGSAESLRSSRAESRDSLRSKRRGFVGRALDSARAERVGGGTYVTTVPSLQNAALHVVTRVFARRARLVVVKSRSADLEVLARWIDQGRLEAVIDRVVPLSDVASGQAHVETKRARGKVVVTV